MDEVMTWEKNVDLSFTMLKGLVLYLTLVVILQMCF